MNNDSEKQPVHFLAKAKNNKLFLKRNQTLIFCCKSHLSVKNKCSKILSVYLCKDAIYK